MQLLVHISFNFYFFCYFNYNLVDPIRYITEFQWDHAKYPTKQSLKNLSEMISKVYYLKVNSINIYL
jgi:hypothetical protein